MTTATKPLPPHGTPYRYRGPRNRSWPGCRCPECTRAHARAQKSRTLARLNGQPPLYPAAPLVAHIQSLLDSGMNYDLIGRRANVASATISYLMRGLSKSCRRENALRILAVQPGDFDDRSDRPALGSQRRAQALYTIGHSPSTIGAAAGLAEATVSHLANGRYNTVDARIATAMCKAYRRLAFTPGASRKAKQRAASQGWHSPLAWDNNIDNPDAKPERLEEYKPAAANGRDSMRKAEIKHLYLLGESIPSITKQLGAKSEKYVSDLLGEILRNRANQKEAA